MLCLNCKQEKYVSGVERAHEGCACPALQLGGHALSKGLTGLTGEVLVDEQ